MNASPSEWIDRRTGRRCRDPIHRGALLDRLHNSRAGWLLTRLILSRKIVSDLYAWTNRRRRSVRKIPDFVREMGVDMDESVRAIHEFESFADFITREIDLSRRPVATGPGVCVAPADGRFLVHPVIGAETRFRLKHTGFDLGAFLRDEELVRRHDGGSMVVCRLYLADYHHFHFPVDGVAGPARTISGRYYATTRYSRRWTVPYLAENHRQVTRLECDGLGVVTMIEVGAFTIGSIRQRFRPHTRVGRGDPKGHFELGGSVVVLLFEPGAIVLDEDLCRNSRAGVETFVRMGERIGRAAGATMNSLARGGEPGDRHDRGPLPGAGPGRG